MRLVALRGAGQGGARDLWTRGGPRTRGDGSVGLARRDSDGRWQARLWYSEVHEGYATGDTDGPSELVIHKLHGSIDWTYGQRLRGDDGIELQPLVDGPRHDDDPLLRVEVVAPTSLAAFYSKSANWYHHPSILLPPSRAKPVAQSELVELWDGVGVYSYLLGGFTVIGCSLPAGDPYLVQLVHHIATDYVAGRVEGGRVWPQRRMQVVDLRSNAAAIAELRERFRFMDSVHTDFLYAGFGEQAVSTIFSDPDLFPDS